MPATIPESHKVKGTRLYATISSTLTVIPGLQNLKINYGEKLKYTARDLDSDYEAPKPAGVRGEASFSGQLLWDPLGTVHQFIHTGFNDDADPADTTTIIVGKIRHGLTGVETSCKYFFTKLEESADANGALMMDVEGVFTELPVLNEADPS